MKVLVTGANGFVGGWLVRRLREAGHEVTGLVGREPSAPVLTAEERAGAAWHPFDLGDAASVRQGLLRPADAVVHLAGVASVADSLRDPVRAWQVNALGTVRVVEALAAHRAAGHVDPVVLVVSTGEVYGRGDGPRAETEPVAPLSPYAASKAAAEVAALEAWRRTGLRVTVARAFPHTGPGQATRFVVPALIHRIRAARREGRPAIPAGNLAPVRDLLDVRDVTAAYLALLELGAAGEVFNVASGTGIPLAGLVDRIGARLGHAVRAEPDPALFRPVDIPALVGDASRLRAATGWSPRWSLDDTLQGMIDAETD